MPERRRRRAVCKIRRLTGAAVGGAAGASIGTVAAATTQNSKEAAIPTEAVLTFTVQ